MSAFIDLTDCRFGRLTVIEQDQHSVGGKTKWLCLCECGATKSVHASDLRTGRTGSCGCLHRELLAKARTTHGMSQTSRFYRIWAEMIRRCTNPNCRSFKDYGGRGITVCAQWRVFESFKQDMYPSYLAFSAEHGEDVTTIERIDVDSGYSVENVCWLLRSDQALNTRTTARAVGVKQVPSGRWSAFIKRRKKVYYKTFDTREQAEAWRSEIAKMYSVS